MEKLARTSLGYTVMGLAGGMYYRELTRTVNFDRQLPTQLRIVHTHCMALGALFFLIVLLLEKSFTLSAQKHFNKFYITYNMGLGISVFSMLARGTISVLSGEGTMPLLSMTSGVGHILLTAGFGFFYNVLTNAVKQVAGTTAKRAKN